MAGELEGRRVLVTGGTSGIGEAVARRAVAAGAQVAVLGRRQARLDALSEELGVTAVAADVADHAAVEVATAAAADALGGLDALVTAAGLARPGPVATSDPADWRTMFEVNVLGTLHAVRAAVPYLVAAGHADLVTISSMSGRRIQSPEMGVYAATKSAVHALSEGLRRELGPEGVRVTTVAPGLVDTPIFAGQEGATAERLREAAPTSGLTPREVADPIVAVLASPPHVLHVEVALRSLHQG
jgi:clavulanate-9-aldehyde reducatase